MSSERVFFIGGTGNVGSKVVADLLKHNIPVTLFARSVEKVNSLFTENQELINVIQGDTENLEPIKEAIKGHTRLFLLYSNYSNFVKVKRTIAEYAYEAGVEQIVDISSASINDGWRKCPSSAYHYDGEKAILEIPNRKAFVALRPGRFMSNIFAFERPLSTGLLCDVIDADQRQGWISPNDIAAVASVVLRDDITKHGDAVYTLISDSVSNRERAEIISRISNKQVVYKQVPPLQRYKIILSKGVPHVMAAFLSVNYDTDDNSKVSYYINILLEREPETLEHYLKDNLDLLC